MRYPLTRSSSLNQSTAASRSPWLADSGIWTSKDSIPTCAHVSCFYARTRGRGILTNEDGSQPDACTVPPQGSDPLANLFEHRFGDRSASRSCAVIPAA